MLTNRFGGVLDETKPVAPITLPPIKLPPVDDAAEMREAAEAQARVRVIRAGRMAGNRLWSIRASNARTKHRYCGQRFVSRQSLQRLVGDFVEDIFLVLGGGGDTLIHRRFPLFLS